ncbi:protein of unknown function (DUF4349) [Gaiella occulta]|uniref:DUF4349 domain-containing protein n=1 Tax=Gaiella occulta TaxID=1002870 RepID=A0A7M2Z1J5_9ACTN|nr:DUF4349 domain-containing protein [Gaiella occulta]RDI75652.1 protein of unknown function (DUF4349) [Gaiella occulta]
MTSAESNLVAELRAARPSADEALRERVRAIAAAGPARRSSRFARLSLRRVALVAVPAAAVVAISVAGVAGLVDSRPGASETVATSVGSLAGPPSPGPAARELAPQAKAGVAADAAAPAPTPGRAQRYSAELTVEVKDVDALSSATLKALQTARDLGGYVVNVAYATSTSGTSTMTLRVPTAQVQDAIVRLSRLGRIVAQQVQIEDLQGQVDELTTRETALRERIARLSARLASTSLDAETRATLAARRDAARAELARVRATRAQVNGEALYATIRLSLQTRQSSLVPAVPSRFDRAFDRAGEILALEATAVLYALVVAGPLAAVALAAWLVRRGLRRRENERLLTS